MLKNKKIYIILLLLMVIMTFMSACGEEVADLTEETSDVKLDQYLTAPVPDGKPNPVEWQDAEIDTEEKKTCTLEIRCDSIFDYMNDFNEDKLTVLPDDGYIYKKKTVEFYEGESVFNVLLREMKQNAIHLEFTMTPIYNSNYIEGINNIYEFDCGELSGWMYKVNGWFPNYGASRYKLEQDDEIIWVYTCDLGRDIGGEYVLQHPSNDEDDEDDEDEKSDSDDKDNN